jgi:hypothetical protein
MRKKSKGRPNRFLMKTASRGGSERGGLSAVTLVT